MKDSRYCTVLSFVCVFSLVVVPMHSIASSSNFYFIVLRCLVFMSRFLADICVDLCCPFPLVLTETTKRILLANIASFLFFQCIQKSEIYSRTFCIHNFNLTQTFFFLSLSVLVFSRYWIVYVLCGSFLICSRREKDKKQNR